MKDEDKDKDKKKGFKVVDRRHWADDQDDSEEAGHTRDKPEYVQQLEETLAKKDELIAKFRSEHRESVEGFEDSRMRIQRETGRDIERNRRELRVEFLEVLDNLDRALQATETDTKAAVDPAAIVKGVEMVRDLFVSKLGTLGVSRIEALGTRFNPAEHEAITVVPSEDPSLDGTVVGIIRDGYVIGEEVLRPVSVAVARKPG
jgi:molecular chaperone GrpE